MCAVCYAVVAVLVLANTQADLCSWYGKGCSGTTIDVSPLNNLTGTIDSTWFATLPTADKAKVLRISNNPGITGIAPGAFSLLTSCTSIDVSQNGVTMIASGVFDPLPELQELTLTKNSINQPLPVLGFPSTLIYLWAGLNHIPSITPGTFDNLTRVDTLWLGGNRLSTLPAHIFDQLTVMTALDLGDNQLQLLPTGVFHSLTSLTTLRLMNNILTYIAPGTFRTLTQLHTLTLRDNSLLVTLDLYLFRNLTSYSPTKTLDLSDTMTALTCVPYPPPITFVPPGGYLTGGLPYCPAPAPAAAPYTTSHQRQLLLRPRTTSEQPTKLAYRRRSTAKAAQSWSIITVTSSLRSAITIARSSSRQTGTRPAPTGTSARNGTQTASTRPPTNAEGGTKSGQGDQPLPDSVAGIAIIVMSAVVTILMCTCCWWAVMVRQSRIDHPGEYARPTHVSVLPTTPARVPMPALNIVPPTTESAQVIPLWPTSHDTGMVPQTMSRQLSPAMQYFNGSPPPISGSVPFKASFRHQRRQVARDKFNQGAMTVSMSSDED
ncbi:hypothetical protein PBRA_008082 [Plasmodiophora brassicae]|uniref:Leucine-rich repeat-containing N-terminal plant-type domain-containing protein n=1 Tax=Plasmodiophora brassicae TaxID=37360 RepID=A0A0G4IZP0_PLABS|nr:hypothetical protein PBRA_008082 [Plasmodiophora brassicae]